MPSLQAYFHQFMQTAAEPTKLLSCQAMTAATSMSMEYDSDQEPPETNDHLYWRLDPEVSLSDMTLVIRTKKKVSASQASAQQAQQQSHTFSSSTVVATEEDNHTVPNEAKTQDGSATESKIEDDNKGSQTGEEDTRVAGQSEGKAEKGTTFRSYTDQGVPELDDEKKEMEEIHDDDIDRYVDVGGGESMLSATAQGEEASEDSSLYRFEETVYHVHKHILAVGSRRSNYFRDLFAVHNSSRSVCSQDAATATFEMDDIAAQAMPILLDYLYDPEGSIAITTENATALHWLGHFFEIRRLRWISKRFLHKDLNNKTCGTYYEHARILKDEKLLKTVSKYCVKHIESINCTSRLIHVPEPDLWLRIFRQNTITNEFSRHMSQMIAEFCKHNQVDADSFSQLTCETYLPVIHGEAALTLIEVESKIVQPDPSSLTSLQERCIRALVRQWETAELTTDRSMSVLQQQSPLVLTSLLTQAIKVVRQDKEKSGKAYRESSNFLFARWKLMPTVTNAISFSSSFSPLNHPKAGKEAAVELL